MRLGPGSTHGLVGGIRRAEAVGLSSTHPACSARSACAGSQKEGLAEVSYWVLPAARGHRVATRALRTLSTWVFDELNLHRVELAHSTLNPASCHVAENAGYTLEGVKRSESLHTDGWHDMHLHARLIDDAPLHP